VAGFGCEPETSSDDQVSRAVSAAAAVAAGAAAVSLAPAQAVVVAQPP
jgi:hypothetical protein